jgi:predicted DNA-binding ribbon-helix-helix protein
VRDDVATAVRPEETAFPLSFEDVEPEFRVVVRDGTRRGIRLERFFWTSLKKLAANRKSTLGQVVDEISRVQPETGNLTSAIRVACTRWLADQNTELRRLASLKTVNAILLACPSPAFALSSSRKILAFNPAFQLLLRRQLPVAQGADARPDLKLALDLNVADIFSRLEANGDLPVKTGFVIGAGDRRYRAQLNVVRAPVSEPELLLAFVFGG